MKLMTTELEKRFEEVGKQGSDPIVIAKFFNPAGAGTWYATEYYSSEKLVYGYVSIYGDHCDEWGYFSLDELESYKGPFAIGIERDLHWEEMPFSRIVTGE